MSIYAYVGLPGSGKSYSVVVNQILPALKLGRRVVTNVPLKRDAIREVVTTGEIVEFPTEQIAQAPELIDQYCTAGSVVIIDEVWRLWPAGQKVNQVPSPFKAVLAEHRHRVDSQGNAMQIVLVTQDLGQIGAFARQLVEQTMHHVKLVHVGSEQTYRVDIYRGPVTGPMPNVDRRLREVFGRYKPQYFKFYQSHTMATGGEVLGPVNERGVDRRGNVFRRPILWVGAAFVILAVVFGTSTIARLIEPESDLPSVASTIASGSITIEKSGSAKKRRTTAIRKTTARAARPSYRILGYVLADDFSVALILDDNFVVRHPIEYCVFNQVAAVSCVYRGWEVTAAGSIGQVIVRR